MKFYLVHDGKETKLPVYRCKKPLFKDVHGRTWDSSNVLLNGETIQFYLDTSWGHYVYFALKDGLIYQWYKVKFSTLEYDIPLFEPTLANIITKD